MTEQTQAVENQEQAQAPELTISDLQNIRAILEVSARRGAYAANEMEAVGGTFNKLTKFLDAVAPQQPAEGAEQAPAAE